jgi:CRP-like cAMP-binding protein
MKMENELAGLQRLETLNEDDIREIATRGRVVDLSSGRHAYQQGDRADSIYIVLDGLIALNHPGSEGRSVSVDIYRPGELFGMSCCMQGPNYLTGARALRESRLLRLPRGLFDQLLARRADFAREMLIDTMQRLAQCRKMRVLASEDARRRVLHVLLSLHEQLGGILPLKRSDIGELAGVAPETVMRTLSPHEKAGLIKTRRGRLEILHADRLRTLAANGHNKN